MELWLLVGGLILGYLFYHYFVADVMNRIQYIEHLRVYWITKNNGRKGVPLVSYSFMQATQAPYWYGKGIQFRIFKWTFQIGILEGKGEDPMAFEDLDVDVLTLREWGRPDHEVDA